MSDEITPQPDELEENTAQPQEETVNVPEMHTEDALRFSLGLFSDLAWIKLGIRSNPATGEAKADMAEAKLAIDALAALTILTEGRFEPNEVRELKNLVSSLQLNYVQRQ